MEPSIVTGNSQDAAGLQDVTQHPVFNAWGSRQPWPRAQPLTSPLQTTKTQVNWWDGPVASAPSVGLRARPKNTHSSLAEEFFREELTLWYVKEYHESSK